MITQEQEARIRQCARDEEHLAILLDLFAQQEAQTQQALEQRVQATEAELRSNLARTEALYGSAQAMIELHDVAHLLELVVENTRAVLDAYGVVLVVVDEAQRQISHVVASGPGGKLVEGLFDYELLVSTGIASWVWREQQATISPRLLRDERDSEQLHQWRIANGVGCIIEAPLRYKDQRLGLLGVLNHIEQHDFSAEDLALTAALANQASVGIANAQLLQSLLERETQYRAVVEQQTEIICRCQPDASLTFVNDAFCHFVAQAAADVIGKNLFEVVYDQDARAQAASDLQAFVAQNHSDYQQHQARRYDGSIRWIQWDWQAIRNDAGEVLEIQMVGRDVSDLVETQNALARSETQYRHLIEASPDGILITRATSVLYANPAASAMLGAAAPGDLEGKVLFDLQHPDVHPDALERISSLGHDHEQARQRHEPYVRLDGRVIDVEVSLTSTQIDEQPATLTFMRDVTARKAQERDQELFHERLVNLHRLGVELSGADSFDEFCRRAVEEGRQRLGFDRLGLWFLDSSGDYMIGSFGTDLEGRTVDERDARLEMDEHIASNWFSKNRPLVFSEEADLVDKRRNVVGAGWRARAALWNGDEILGLIGADNLLSQEPPSPQQLEILLLYGLTLGHLAARIRTEEALRQSEARYRAVFEGAGIGIVVVRPDGRIVSANPTFLQIVGYDLDYIRQVPFSDYTHPEDRSENLQLFTDLIEGRRSQYQFDKRYIRADGVITWVRMYVSPYPSPGDDEALVLAMVEDIAQQKEYQDRLQESEARNRALLKSVPDMILRLSVDGTYLDCHTSRPDLLLQPVEQLLGKNFRDVQPARLRAETEKHLQLALETGEVQSYEVPLFLNGELRHFDNRLAVYDENQFLLVVRDVTERAKALEQMRESETRFRQIADNVDEIFFIQDSASGEMLFISRAYERLWGKSAEELYRDSSAWLELVHPDDLQRVKKLSANRFSESEFEYRIIRADGEVRWLWVRKFPIENEQGQVYRVAGLTKDITGRKEMEKTNLQLAVQQEQVKILSDFIRDASHAFRTPLSIINSKVYLAGKIDDSAARQAQLEGIERQSYHILNLVESLVTITRLDSGVEFNSLPLSINSVLDAVEAMNLSRAADSRVKLVLEVEPGLPTIMGNVEDLHIALCHLVNNAFDHSAPGGMVALRTYGTDDKQIAIEVSDTGPGILPEEVPRIFERFYRGDKAGTTLGFGLGLPIALRIVEGHGGRIEVHSTPGQGSTFTMILPTASESERRATSSA